MIDPNSFEWRNRYANSLMLFRAFCLPYYQRRLFIPEMVANENDAGVVVHADLRYMVHADHSGNRSALTGVSVVVDQKSDIGQTNVIRKRTPLEQAIAEKTDKRARYEARLRREGFKRTTIWVREERLEEVKAFIHQVNEGIPGEPTP